jgi:hypothetical protein
MDISRIRTMTITDSNIIKRTPNISANRSIYIRTSNPFRITLSDNQSNLSQTIRNDPTKNVMDANPK